MRTLNKQIATNVVLNTNVNSDFVPLKNIYMYSIMAIVTGTPTGTIKLQASSDPETNDTQPNMEALKPVNWADIVDSSFTLTTAGNTMWNVRETGYNYVRVVYVDASGGTSTATMSIIANCKGV